jgi:hypothetical protein
MSSSIPAHFMRDRYWASMIHLFQNHYKLEDVFTTKYFDFNAGRVKIQALKKNAAVWSSSEKILLNLALHLFNEKNKFNLSDLDYLDSNNRQLAYEAIKIRFGN